MMAQSYLETHKHIRRIVFGAAILVGLAALGLMFGWDEVRMLGRSLLSQAGLIAMEGAPQ